MRTLFLLCLPLLTLSLHAQQTLSLDECRQLAVQNNKELRISAEKIKASSAEKKAAFTNYFPKVSAAGSYFGNEKDLNLVDYTQLGDLAAMIPSVVQEATRLDIENVWVAGVSLVQPVFMGGKIVSYNQIAKYAEELAESMIT
jgi:outer membrane protein TolC